MRIELAGQHFILSPDKAIYWEEKQILIISDAHFSKEAHFRKNGIAVPSGILQTDLQKLDRLIEYHHPKKVIFLGDMFHSEENEGLNEFMSWRKKNAKKQLVLITGNHDILHADWYGFAGIEVTGEQLKEENIIFSHEKIALEDENLYNFSGHLHPCIVMHGAAKQSLRMPCFWFGVQHAILPAFGSFTGAKAIRPKKEDQIFAIGENEIFRLQ